MGARDLSRARSDTRILPYRLAAQTPHALVVALNRAARCLIAAGKVQAMHWCTRGGAGLGYVTVYRFDHLKPTDRAQVTRLFSARPVGLPRAS